MPTENTPHRCHEEKPGGHDKPVKSPGGIAKLRAENKALRHQVVSLQQQWDVLKTTLGVLSTTVSSQEPV